MNRKVYRTAHAAADLEDIWSYIAEDNESAADALLDRFDEVFSLLANTPSAGRLRPEFAEDLRTFPVERYVVCYVATSDRVTIVRVLSGYRDIAALF